MADYVQTATCAFEKYKYLYGGRELFLDFVNYEMAFFQIKLGNEKFVSEYERLTKKYPQEILDLFQNTIEGLIKALDEDPKDYLGEIYSHFGTRKKGLGQCFTPSCVSVAMAELDDTVEQIKACKDKVFKVNDPCCGSGSLLLGLIKTWKKHGINYALDTLIIAQDIDSNVAYMCYLQLALCGASAIIIVGNSLLFEVKEEYATLACMIQNMLA